MASDLGGEDVVRICEEDGKSETSSMCLIGKVLTNKSFNAFGLLEAMKKAMNPPHEFTAKEIGKNLFSFQFRSSMDFDRVLAREPWHFDKHILMLKELGKGEQPSAVMFDKPPFWIRIYDLPVVARKQKTIGLLAGKCDDLVEMDAASLKGLTRSVRAKVSVDISKPLTKGTLLELNPLNRIWISFKYERLPSFCYICGLLGHMRKECDLLEGVAEIEEIPEEKLPYGEWMRASPMKNAAVTVTEQKTPKDCSSLRRKLFEKFKQSIREEEDKGTTIEEEGKENRADNLGEIEEIRTNLAQVTVKPKENMMIDGMLDTANS
ncbi:hypothetical protein ACS0TY_018782 [Phlomoides rotata]